MGLFSRRKKNMNSQFAMPALRLQTDFHSHILPGIDDGAQTVDESIEMLKEFVNQGYNKLITTPHIHTLRYKNTIESINKSFNILKEEMINQNINIDLQFAAEYYVDNEFVKLIKEDQILSTSDFNYVLIEFAFQMPPIGTAKIFNLLQEKSYNPIIAHPERYEYWNGNLSLFSKLKDQGFLFQGNLLSANGGYGPNAQRNFEMLANNNMYDFLGSDAHDAESVKEINEIIKLPIVQKVILNGINNHSL